MNNQPRFKNAISEIPANAVEIYRMLPEGTRCEVIFNELIMSPSPTSLHQLLLSDLHVLLYNFLKQAGLGKILLSPIDVYLEGSDSVIQPDLAIILNDKLDQIKKDGVYGAPAVVIEILSTNRTNDTKRKKALYENAGVKEYFLIDPENKDTILLSLNDFGVYEQHYKSTGRIISGLLGCNLMF